MGAISWSHMIVALVPLMTLVAIIGFVLWLALRSSRKAQSRAVAPGNAFAREQTYGHAGAADASSTAGRLQALDALLAQGQVTQAEYDAQRVRIIGSV